VVILGRKQKNWLPTESWIGVSIAADSGLILTARVGRHTDELIGEIVESTTEH